MSSFTALTKCFVHFAVLLVAQTPCYNALVSLLAYSVHSGAVSKYFVQFSFC